MCVGRRRVVLQGGNEWSTTSKAGRSLMLNRVEKQPDVVVACRTGTYKKRIT